MANANGGYLRLFISNESIDLCKKHAVGMRRLNKSWSWRDSAAAALSIGLQDFEDRNEDGEYDEDGVAK